MTFDETKTADCYFGAMKVQVICHVWHLRWKECDLKLLSVFHHRSFEGEYHQKLLSYLNISFSEAKTIYIQNLLRRKLCSDSTLTFEVNYFFRDSGKSVREPSAKGCRKRVYHF